MFFKRMLLIKITAWSTLTFPMSEVKAPKKNLGRHSSVFILERKLIFFDRKNVWSFCYIIKS